ncbi:MAG: CpsD/CapB family tyrosine-protein kinase [Oscillospiraceae bacterium]|nr:CpsD/CapB family tyrosine-protein kinase [Oscillospiraceae bacterium]
MNYIRRKKPLTPIQRQKILLTEKSPFAMQEAFKELRTNVMFSLPGTGCKCVGVTSPTPGDGKSTTAANLAISLAQIGKRVILIDCDMRLPTVADSFRIAAVPGLSDFLSGQAPVDACVRQVERYRLSVMPAGNIPPDPTGLLEDAQMERLINAFRSVYDYVIVDLPPVTAVPDASILSKYIDGFLLVIRNRQTRHRYVAEMIRQLQLTKSKIIGFTAVGGDLSAKKYYKHKYSQAYDQVQR